MPKKKIKDPDILEGAVREVMSRYVERIRDRCLPFSLSFAKFKELIFSPCSYCKAPAEESIKTVYMNEWEYCRNTIDRVDSSEGYTPENSVPACLRCNNDKSDLDVIEWLQWIHKVAEATKDYPGLKEAPPLNHRKFIGKLQLNESRKQYAVRSAYYRGVNSRGG